MSCLIYGGLGLSGQGGEEGVVNTTREVLTGYYHLSLWTLLPVLCVLILSVKRVNVKITLGVSAICAGMISVLVQGLPVAELLRVAWSGFTAKEETVNRLMSGGGILSNLRVIAPLIPWSIAGAVPLAAIGAPTSSVCAACYLYLLPLWSFVRELWEIKTKRVGLYK